MPIWPDERDDETNLAETLDGISLGVNGLVFAHAKIIVGIGAFGFVTGPYVGYNTVVVSIRRRGCAAPPTGALNTRCDLAWATRSRKW